MTDRLNGDQFRGAAGKTAVIIPQPLAPSNRWGAVGLDGRAAAGLGRTAVDTKVAKLSWAARQATTLSWKSKQVGQVEIAYVGPLTNFRGWPWRSAAN